MLACMYSPDASSILAIIPAHNEAGRIAPVIAQTLHNLPVLVVDDGSSDDTSAIARAAGAEVLRQTPNQGKGQALKAGFRLALAGNVSAVVMLDADGQHDPAEIPAFLSAWRERAPDLIIGKRDFHSMPFPRNVSNAIGRAMFTWAVGRSIEDNQSGYRLVSRRLMQAALDSRHGGFEFEVDMIVISLRNHWSVEEIPIRTIYGNQTSHIQPIKHIQRYTRLVWEARKAMNEKTGTP
jgi:glycosyltransferase involved in cell wall biosynthesis